MPQQDLDLRSRLDSRGERKGKVVDWKLSELRAMELLEGICKNMADYSIVTGNDGVKRYQKIQNVAGGVTISGSMSFGGEGQGDQGKELRLYCDGLIENHEEALTEAVQEVEGLRQKLCVDTAHLCSNSQLDKLVEENIVRTPETKTTEDKRGTEEVPRKMKKKKKRKKNKKGKAKHREL